VTIPPALRMMWASPVLEAERLLDRQPGIHTGNDCQLASRRHRELAQSETSGIGFVRLEDFINNAHGLTSQSMVLNCVQDSRQFLPILVPEAMKSSLKFLAPLRSRRTMQI
jgi:hypothetical protein